MTQSTDHKTARNRYPDEFREHALALSLRIGVSKAARELSLHESQLYAWRKKQQQALTNSAREQQLTTENAKLTCKLNGVEPEGWLRDVLGKINDWPSNRVHELLPWNLSTVK